MKRGKKIMVWLLGVIVLIVLCVMLWFNLSYSPTKSEFKEITSNQISEMQPQNGLFTIEDISKLPSPVQKHFQYCGYIGTPKMSNMKAYYNDVDFVLYPDKPKLKIKYIQYNFVDEPARIAFIDTSMYGVPFEGMDTYQNGIGSMKGVIAKAFTLFNQKGEGMDKSSLVTILSESLLMPNLALQDYVSWEEIDETHARATITYYGISASGIFTFDDNGAMIMFTTDDRENTDTNGNIQKVKWSAICGGYKELNGIKYPTSLQAVWHYETGDLVYFDGRNIVIKYDVAN
ncbi:hypothetical protein BACCIP111895_04824 [Neobacillus rhizosphaerae]|uniref:DUF4825 domain-containing protein n=1 Tax=Neobacillus rhizosphaerae TaxID=2880965 RepID=A0ABN8KZ22_9BACI|nr:DUF6544 family protein [Neobacillus rhizosphaerae]CAH2717608.1 hypothetical protein BACCIP111895_04824 [Neobacillus rhizosphaerae]